MVVVVVATAARAGSFLEETRAIILVQALLEATAATATAPAPLPAVVTMLGTPVLLPATIAVEPMGGTDPTMAVVMLMVVMVARGAGLMRAVNPQVAVPQVVMAAAAAVLLMQEAAAAGEELATWTVPAALPAVVAGEEPATKVAQVVVGAMDIGIATGAVAVVDRHTVSMAAVMTDGILVPLRL